MPELLAIQRGIAASLRHAGADPQSMPWISGDAAFAQQRLAIYRANVAASVAKALSAAYPVIRQVVGDEFFEALTRAYDRISPSTSGDLFDHGEGFAAFVSSFPHTRHLPYLPDLARLEWAAHRAYGAEDAPTWNPATLDSVAPEQQTAIAFDWAAGTALIPSEFPIVRIWTIHQADHEGEFEVDWSVPECAWVARRGLRVEVSRPSAGDATFLRSMLGGGTLGEAAPAALSADPNFDLGALLARLIASNLITGFRVVPEDGSTPTGQMKAAA